MAYRPITPRRRAGLILAGVALAGLAAAVVVFSGALTPSVVSRNVETALTPDEMKALAPRGRQVADAADCYACHTARGGAPWAGGLPLETPFGVIHSTNISPSREGIAGWSRAEFHRAMRDGVAKGGRHLYPAMPYTSYRGMSQEDVDAVYAFIMSRDPVAVENKPNGLGFPFNQRWTLAGWNLLNLPKTVATPDKARSALWNRGNYVANVLGHCGECHTPRNALQAMRSDAALKGASIEGVEAPDITAKGLGQMGFDPASLVKFMKLGLSVQGGATNQMFDVMHYSTQHMDDADLAAMTAYLFDLDALPETSEPPAPPKPVEVAQELAIRARATFDGLCAGCHGMNGDGVPHVSVPLRTNAALRTPSPSSFLRAVLAGVPAQRFPNDERMEPMPAFADMMSDAELADLATWMRAQWGGEATPVAAADVARMRKAVSRQAAQH